jgi:hypothetical protein
MDAGPSQGALRAHYRSPGGQSAAVSAHRLSRCYSLGRGRRGADASHIVPAAAVRRDSGKLLHSLPFIAHHYRPCPGGRIMIPLSSQQPPHLCRAAAQALHAPAVASELFLVPQSKSCFLPSFVAQFVSMRLPASACMASCMPRSAPRHLSTTLQRCRHSTIR